ncbi:UNVERIFIED_CONTAM: putative N-acetyltransferase p20 [Sesamum calycinum]|uniref:N-acetyltransferase p20 n=1 Tax=Sesamum calycinum TaxID=2727403 RepID=A0AAW2R8Z0_9LAMI
MERYSDSDITLRPLDVSDADDFMKWYYLKLKILSFQHFSNLFSLSSKSQKQVLRRKGERVLLMGHLHFQRSRHPIRRGQRNSPPWHKAICVSGRPVGSISVSPFTGRDKCRAEVGYVVASDYWGKGIATRAVKMAANAVFVEWGELERLEAVVAVKNTASQRVLEKAGFMREGVLRKYSLLKGRPTDAVIFSLLSTDPQVNFFMDA